MRSVYLPLLPLPVLAAIVAFSACSSRTDEPTTRVIPPATTLAPAPPPAPAAHAPVAAAPTGDDAPSEQEIREFQRPVRK
jgi:hypothetical protein